jgi:hypothetical protein
MGRHVRPPRRQLRVRLRRLKRRARGARLQPRLWEFNGPVPYQVSVTFARPQPRAQKIRPSKGAITDQLPRDLLDKSGRQGALDSKGLLISSSRAGLTTSP